MGTKQIIAQQFHASYRPSIFFSRIIFDIPCDIAWVTELSFFPFKTPRPDSNSRAELFRKWQANLVAKNRAISGVKTASVSSRMFPADESMDASFSGAQA